MTEHNNKVSPLASRQRTELHFSRRRSPRLKPRISSKSRRPWLRVPQKVNFDHLTYKTAAKTTLQTSPTYDEMNLFCTDISARNDLNHPRYWRREDVFGRPNLFNKGFKVWHQKAQVLQDCAAGRLASRKKYTILTGTRGISTFAFWQRSVPWSWWRCALRASPQRSFPYRSFSPVHSTRRAPVFRRGTFFRTFFADFPAHTTAVLGLRRLLISSLLVGQISLRALTSRQVTCATIWKSVCKKINKKRKYLRWTASFCVYATTLTANIIIIAVDGGLVPKFTLYDTIKVLIYLLNLFCTNNNKYIFCSLASIWQDIIIIISLFSFQYITNCVHLGTIG